MRKNTNCGKIQYETFPCEPAMVRGLMPALEQEGFLKKDLDDHGVRVRVLDASHPCFGDFSETFGFKAEGKRTAFVLVTKNSPTKKSTISLKHMAKAVGMFLSEHAKVKKPEKRKRLVLAE